MAAKVRAVCGGQRAGDRRCGTGVAGIVERSGGGYLGAVGGAGGPCGWTMAGVGAGSGRRIERRKAGRERMGTVAAAYPCGFCSEGGGQAVQPEPGRFFGASEESAVGRVAKRKSRDGRVVGAAIAEAGYYAADGVDRRDDSE